jgi:nitroimidazol reductase NimA-like FMN-containing flavoprotein (pyridoxamine 5'-phosphate oxidase superfamily)
MAKPKPVFRDLSAGECQQLLRRHHVGRLALTHKDRVEIVPIHYVADDGWIYGRTAAGSKLETAAHNRWVAFEIDEVEALFDWRSVVARGGLYVLRSDGSEQERANYDLGVKAIRTLVPEALTPNDPVPDRAILFRIHVDELTGRESRTRG